MACHALLLYALLLYALLLYALLLYALLLFSGPPGTGGQGIIFPCHRIIVSGTIASRVLRPRWKTLNSQNETACP